jgi:hypothetical protein
MCGDSDQYPNEGYPRAYSRGEVGGCHSATVMPCLFLIPKKKILSAIRILRESQVECTEGSAAVLHMANCASFLLGDG